jgi:hypothetical protein
MLPSSPLAYDLICCYRSVFGVPSVPPSRISISPYHITPMNYYIIIILYRSIESLLLLLLFNSHFNQPTQQIIYYVVVISLSYHYHYDYYVYHLASIPLSLPFSISIRSHVHHAVVPHALPCPLVHASISSMISFVPYSFPHVCNLLLFFCIFQI